MQINKEHKGLEAGVWGLENSFSDQLASLLSCSFFYPVSCSQPPASHASVAPSLVMALSGGADSMACALLADNWVRARGGKLVTLTVDHGLREGSRAEAAQVAAWMRARGIEHHILTPMHTPAGNNMLQAARQWRYDALVEWCTAHDVLHCLLGHHADDQTETTVLNALRGDTEDGGSGMARIRGYRGVRFLRPLLDRSKEELKNYLRNRAADWIEDPSNAQTKFARVRVRDQLRVDAALAASAKDSLVHAAEQRRARDQAFANAAVMCVTIHAAGYASVSRAVWLALPAALQSRIVADTLRCISGATQRARKHEISRLTHALCATTNGKCSLQHCLITWNEAVIYIMREPARVASPITLVGAGRAWWDQRFTVQFSIPDGMTCHLAALGSQGKKQLPFGKELPVTTPALWHLEEVLMVPHIPFTASSVPPDLVFDVGFSPAKPLAAAAFW